MGYHKSGSCCARELFIPAGNRFPASAIIFSLVLICSSCSKGTAGKTVDASAANRTVPVRVVQVNLKQVRRDVESVGSLFPYEEVAVSSEVEGKVEEVLSDVGDSVAKGQALVKVSPIELQLTLDQQRAFLQQARARLGLKEGADLRDVSDAAEVKKAQADLNDAKQKYDRAKALLDQGLVPKQNFDEAEARYKAARATYDLAVQSIDNIQAQISQYKATTELAKKKVSDTTIRAPFAGRIKERSVTAGQYLKVQSPVFLIVNVDPLRVRLKVPEKMASWIKTGQTVSVSVEAQPGRTFQGKVSRINPVVDQQTRAFEVEALVENHEGLLKPGFFVKATIPSDRVESGLFIPQEALQYIYGVYKIFAVEGTVLKEKEVKVGDRSGNEVEIIEGLSEGEKVAIAAKGQELRDKATIEAVK